VYKLQAGAINHTIPCWGYVFTEKDQAGQLNLEKLMNTKLASRRVGPWLGELKRGKTIEGVTREMVCGPTLRFFLFFFFFFFLFFIFLQRS
jgi:hypothetical protein